MGLSAIVEPGCALLLEALQSGVVAEELPVVGVVALQSRVRERACQ